jgi:predicted phosphodiesterase
MGKILRSIVISDTHNQHNKLNFSSFNDSDIDMIIHCGDFSNDTESTSNNFIEWYGNLPYKYKILIAGNHDKYAFENNEDFKRICKELDIIYLEDSSITIEGVKFYGTPWVTDVGDQSFMMDDFELSEIWDNIPLDTEILITHTPQAYVLDTFYDGNNEYNVGSRTLSEAMNKFVKLRFHLFGHVHGDYGETYENYSNLDYLSINAASPNNYVVGLNKPFIIEI